MVGDARVVVDGAEPSGPRRSESPRWVVLLVGLLAGVVLGAGLFSSGNSQEEAIATTVPEDNAGPTFPRFGVTGLLPDFPDALVAVAAVDTEEGASLTHVLWPPARDEVTRELLDGVPGPSAFDTDGVWIAVTTIEEDGLTLHSGRGLLRHVADKVTSFSWHDSESGVLSYTTTDEDQNLEMYTTRGAAPPRLQDSGALGGAIPAGSVAAWGDWGWAVQEDGSNPRVWVVDQGGALISVVDGMVYDSDPSGKIAVVTGDEIRVVSLSDQVPSVRRQVGAIEPVQAAKFSPDGKTLAVLGLEGMIVFPVGGEGIVSNFHPLVGFPQVAWSSDSRFVMVPGPTGVSVFDTETNSAAEALVGYGVRTVGVIPLTSS